MNRARHGPLPVILAGVACTAGPAPPDASRLDVIEDRELLQVPLELGTGQSAWQTVPPTGGRVELIHGPQGGYHIFGRVRFQGLAPNVVLSFRVTPLESSTPINAATERLRLAAGRGLVPRTEGWETSNAQLVVLDAIRDARQVVGRRFRWQAFVQPADSQAWATTEREIVIVDEE